MSTTTQNEWTKKARDYILSKSQSGAYDLAGDIEDEVSDLVILLADARKEVIDSIHDKFCEFAIQGGDDEQAQKGIMLYARTLQYITTLRKETVSDPSGFVTEIVVTIEKPKI